MEVLVTWLFENGAYHRLFFALMQVLADDRQLWPQCIEAVVGRFRPGSHLGMSNGLEFKTLVLCKVDPDCMWAIRLEESQTDIKDRPKRGIHRYRKAPLCHRQAMTIVRIGMRESFRAKTIVRWASPQWDASMKASFSYLLVSDKDFPTLEGWYHNHEEMGRANRHGVLLFASVEEVFLPWSLCSQSLKIMPNEQSPQEEDFIGAVRYFADEVVPQVFLPGASLATGDYEASVALNPEKSGKKSQGVRPKRSKRRKTPKEQREEYERKKKKELRDKMTNMAKGKKVLKHVDTASSRCSSSINRQRICVYNARDAAVHLPDDWPLLWAALGMERSKRALQMGSTQLVVFDPSTLCREMQAVPHPFVFSDASSLRPICDMYYGDPERSYRETDEKVVAADDVPSPYRVYMYASLRVYRIDRHFPTLKRYRIRTDEGGAVLAHESLVDKWFVAFETYEQALMFALDNGQVGHVRDEVPCFRWSACDPLEKEDVIMERGAVA